MTEDRAADLPHQRCARTEPHSGHIHVNEGPRGGCGLPEWCPGVEDRAADALREVLEVHATQQVRRGYVLCRCDEEWDGTDSQAAHQADMLNRHAMPALLAAEREKALLAVQSYSEAELAAERERGRVDGLREAHRQILGLLGAPAPAGLAEPAPGEEASRG